MDAKVENGGRMEYDDTNTWSRHEYGKEKSYDDVVNITSHTKETKEIATFFFDLFHFFIGPLKS